MKLLGGIGYILNLIPLVNFVAPILVGIAWIQMGGKTRITLFKATGAFYLSTFILAVAVVAFLFGSLFDVFSMISAGMGGQPFDPQLLEIMLGRLFGNFLVIFILAIMVAVIGFISFVLELAAHFRAGSVFNVRWFKAAAWLRIVLIIIGILIVGVLVFAITSSPLTPPTDLFTFTTIFPLLLIVVIIPGILSQIFSAIAFFTIPELPPPPQY